MLRMIAIRFDKKTIEQMIPIPGWHKHIPEALRQRLYRRAKLDLLMSIRKKYRNQNLPLTIVG
ncbi:hypothetical protein D0T24_30780 [Duganella sp. BJB480]|nr:hypothetical protein D0T24_30780 [Duganella sp. BJB480]